MKRLLWLMAALLLSSSCTQDPGNRVAGGWTDTETGPKVTGIIRREDGSGAAGALVLLRPSDYLGKDPTKADSIGTSASNGTILDGVCDSTGHFQFDSLRMGQYALEARDKEIKAVLTRFTIDKPNGKWTLAPATAHAMGRLAGHVRFSNGRTGAVLVRIYGLERAALADPATGAYSFDNLPGGTFNLRFSPLVPFAVATDKPGVLIEPGLATDAGETVIPLTLKQGYSIQAGRVALPGIDSTNPVIFENGMFYNPVDGAYLWAKASMGHLDLRGTLISYARDTVSGQLTWNLQNYDNLIKLARNSGMRGMLAPTIGATRPLRPSPTGRIEDIIPDSSAGSLLILAEARKCTPDKPLVFISGANLTTIAQALLIDPLIADRVVVLGANNGNFNDQDTLALQVVADKARYVSWARKYVWPASGLLNWRTPDVFLPNPFGEVIKRQFTLDRTQNKAFTFYADFGPATYLYKPEVWHNATSANRKAAPLEADTAVDPPYDFVDIPGEANDWEAIQAEFISTMANPAAYHPWPATEKVEGEAYASMSGDTVEANAEENDDVTRFKAAGSWAAYQVQAEIAADYTFDLRYLSVAGGSITIADGTSGLSATVTVAAGAIWADANATLHLDAGVHTLRISSAAGTFLLNYFTGSHP